MNAKVFLIAVGAILYFYLAWWYLGDFFSDDRNGDPDQYGYFLVDGRRDKLLGVELRKATQPIVEEGPGKRIESLNVTLNELIYHDPEGRDWFVPKGTVNDGASVPPLLESIVAGGLNTDARYAAVVHDHFCDEMHRGDGPVPGGFDAIHRMFYHAMLCSKVDRRRAGLMYAAVVKFGPPRDRSLWMRIIAQSKPHETDELVADSTHALSSWIGDKKLIEVDDRLLLMESDSAEKFELAQTQFSIAVQEKAQAEKALAEIRSRGNTVTAAQGAVVRPSSTELASGEIVELASKAGDELAKTTRVLNEAKSRVTELQSAEVEMVERAKMELEEFEALREAFESVPEGELDLDKIDALIGFSKAD